MSLFAQQYKWTVILIGIFIIVAILLLTLSISKRNSFPIVFNPTPTSIPLSFTSKTYTNTNQNLVLKYPQNWSLNQNESPQGNVAVFNFTENGNKYVFIASAPGQSETDASLMTVDKLEATVVTYGGRKFLKKVWSYQGKPVRINASPNERGFIFDNFTMDIPDGNEDEYLGIFDQIMNSMQIPPEPENEPLPTLIGPTVIYIPTVPPAQ